MAEGSELVAQRRRELERRMSELSPAKRADIENAWANDPSQTQDHGDRQRTIPHRDPAAPTPMSFAQELLWLLERANPGHGYNVPRVARLRGPLNADALQQTLDTIVQRHEVLRTVYDVRGGVPLQFVQPAAAVPIESVDLRILPAGDREGEAVREVRERSRRPFDLTSDLQLRVTVIILNDDDHVLLLESHHVASDAWSHNILLREIAVLYRSYCAGTRHTLAPVVLQYGDFAAWQRAYLSSRRLEPLLMYWRTQLADAPVLLELPTDRPRGPGISFDGAARSALVPPALLDQLQRLSRERNVTLFMTILAAFDVLLARLCGQVDIVVGSPIAGRILGDTEGIVGYFANMLILRISVADDPAFSALLGQVRETVLAAFDHQEVPFETLVMELSRHQAIARGIPFNVMFTLQDVALESLRLEGTTLSPFGANRGATKFDLSLVARETPDGLRITFEFRTDLFEPATIERMLGQFQVLLAAVAADPGVPVSMLPVLSATERAETIARWNDTETPIPLDRSLGQLLAEQASRTPGAVAVEAEDANGNVTRLTYAEVDRQAARLAHRLRGIGVGPGVGVAICAERSPLLVVAILGVLRSGGYYIPLDPEYPADRVMYMLETAAPRVVLTTDEFRELVEPAPLASESRTVIVLGDQFDDPGGHGTLDAVSAGAEDLAYVIFTSGSTGRPKGVMIPNRAVVNYLTWMQREYPLASSDAVLQKAPASFDACIWEFFLPLLVGARLVLARRGGHQDPEYLLAAIERHDLSVLQLVPSQLAIMLETVGDAAGTRLRRLRYLFLGGEALRPDLVRRLRSAAPELAVANLYGPTEATVYSTHWQVPVGNWDADVVPIGRPIANTCVYVLDARSEPVPFGVPGELYIGGFGVARGYINRPDLTAERFVVDRFSSSGALMYRTGDRARWCAEGTLQYLGRLDSQVKLRGFRIELAEIERALIQDDAVQSAVAMVREDAVGDQRLVAYCVPATAMATDLSMITKLVREGLRRTLPHYMIPATIVWLENWPLSANGKLDRNALPIPTDRAHAVTNLHVEPRTALEREIVDSWERLLGVSCIGVNDDFFELGGNSLLAIRMIAEVDRLSTRKFQLRWLFDHATVAEIAAMVTADASETEDGELLVLQKDGPGTPLAFAHGDVIGYGWYCRRLAPLLGPSPLIVLPTYPPRSGAPVSIEAMARAHLDRLRSAQPRGPYRVGGFCAGGLVAFELARLLVAQGEQVAVVIMVDTFFANRRFRTLEPLARWLSRGRNPEMTVSRRARFYGLLRYYLWRVAVVRRMPLGARFQWLVKNIRRRVGVRKAAVASKDVEQVNLTEGAIPEAGLGPIGEFVVRAQRAYMPTRYPGRVHLVWASEKVARSSRNARFDGGWERMVQGFETSVVEGAHSDLVMPHRLPALAEAIRAVLDAASNGP
jgi:amino acid adenylation domain-containing protein